MPLFERGDISIYYEEHGSATGFPAMIFPWGGLDATVERWKQPGAFAPIQRFSEYRVIILDQRNAGHSSGPLDFDDPWGGYADDHRGLADHLGIDRFHVLGQCVGCPYALTLAKRAPTRIASWSKELLRKRPGLDVTTLEKFTQRMVSGEFVFSVSREDVRSCLTPLLVLPGVDSVHPPAIGRAIAALARNAPVMDRWKETRVQTKGD